MQSVRKVLLIEDEQEYQLLVNDILRDDFRVIMASSSEEAMILAKNERPDVILLDIKMPKGNGVRLCEEIRVCEQTQHIPVLMLTAARDIESRVGAFSAGADDFISKPFTSDELLARINSKIRRIEEKLVKPKAMRYGNLSLDLSTREVVVADQKIILTLLEFNLLKFFLENQDRILSRKEILTGVWQGCVITDRTVDSHIASLRKKLRNFNRTITTVHGSGYILK